MGDLSHLDAAGRASMVDVSAKPSVPREAVAGGFVAMAPETLALVRDAALAKGDVLTVARIAGIAAAKRCGDLIPLCHPLPLTHVAVDCELVEDGVRIEASARTNAPTGVEMEALTAVSVAALTIYDMCKAADKAMVIREVRLVRKVKG